MLRLAKTLKNVPDLSGRKNQDMERIFNNRRIQLFIDSDEKEYIGEVYKKLYSWQNICHRAANFIFTHHYIQEQLKELIYITDEVKVKLADIKKDEDGILTTSKMNTSYQVLSRHFKGDIPMHIISSLNNTMVANFNNEKLQYFKGERSLRNYRKDIPIPFKGTDIKFTHTSYNGKVFHFNLFSIPFRTYLGQDIYDKRILLQHAMEGKIKICTSSLKLDKAKIYMLATFEIEKEEHKLDEGLVAEASLSMEFPITVSIGKAKYTIGNKEEFLYRRLAIQSAVKRKQDAAKYCRAQNGKKRRYKAVKQLQDAEKNYVKSKHHLYSRRLIDLCVKHGAGTLLLCNQQDKEEAAKENSFLLRNWGYSELKQKIEYKATKAGITLIVE